MVSTSLLQRIPSSRLKLRDVNYAKHVYYHRRMAETEKDIFHSMDESRFMVGGRFKKMTGSTMSIKKVMVKT